MERDKIPKWAVLPTKSGSWQLTTQHPETGRESWVLDDKAGNLIGRNGQVVDVVVDQKSSSRVHACIAFDAAGDAYLVDLGSAHGTMLNGQRVEKGGRERLSEGDSISIAACPHPFVIVKRSPVRQGGGGGGANGRQDPTQASGEDAHKAAATSRLEDEPEEPPAVSRWENGADLDNRTQAQGATEEPAAARGEHTQHTRSSAADSKAARHDVAIAHETRDACDARGTRNGLDRSEDPEDRARSRDDIRGDNRRLNGQVQRNAETLPFSGQDAQSDGRHRQRHDDRGDKRHLDGQAERDPEAPPLSGQSSEQTDSRLRHGLAQHDSSAPDARTLARDHGSYGTSESSRNFRDQRRQYDSRRSNRQSPPVSGRDGRDERGGQRFSADHGSARGPRGSHDMQWSDRGHRNDSRNHAHPDRHSRGRALEPYSDDRGPGRRPDADRLSDRQRSRHRDKQSDRPPGFSSRQPSHSSRPSRHDDRHEERQSDRHRDRQSDSRRRGAPSPSRRRRSPSSRRRSHSPLPRKKRRTTSDSPRMPQRTDPQPGSGFGSGATAVVSSNPAEVVRAMMGVNGIAPPMPTGGSFLGVEQKKRLLWGGKKAEATVAAVPSMAATAANPEAAVPSAAAAGNAAAGGGSVGANRWDTAEFDDEAEKDKFHRLMGVKGGPPAPGPAGPQAVAKFDRVVTGRGEQERLKADLERNFLEGVRRGGNNAVGLGL